MIEILSRPHSSTLGVSSNFSRTRACQAIQP
jgi:hypothetical protein